MAPLTLTSAVLGLPTDTEAVVGPPTETVAPARLSDAVSSPPMVMSVRRAPAAPSAVI